MPDLLIACGRALYGERWQSPLARDLGVSDRTMRRWATGAYPVPPGVLTDLLPLVKERCVELDTLRRRLTG